MANELSKINTTNETVSSNLNNIFIENWDVKIIEDLVLSQDYKIELIKVLTDNQQYLQINNAFKFYTNRSLIRRNTEKLKWKQLTTN